MARRSLALLLLPLALAALAVPGAQAAETVVDIAINTARVWLTTMEELAFVVGQLTASKGQPPADTSFTITRAHSMNVAGYMVAASNGQVADIAAAITAFTASDLQSGYTEPMLQFPYGWAPSEVFYNVPELGDTPLRLDACAIASILQGNITSWSDPVLAELNPEAALPDEPLTLVYLNLSMPITTCLTKYLSAQCPEGWPYGEMDDLGDVVQQLPSTEVVASTDVEFNWREVNSTEYSICIGASMPVGLYVQKYPAAMQRAALRIADGSFVEPTNELNEVAVAELAALAAVSPEDWSFLDARSPARYPVAYWGLATMARNLTAQGERGLYIKDTAGFLLTKQGQAMVNETFEANLPDALMPAALKAWRSVDVAAVADVETGIPTPELNGGVPVPLNPTPDSSPVPSPPPSGAWRLSTLSCPLLLVAAVAAAVLA